MWVKSGNLLNSVSLTQCLNQPEGALMLILWSITGDSTTTWHFNTNERINLTCLWLPMFVFSLYYRFIRRAFSRSKKGMWIRDIMNDFKTQVKSLTIGKFKKSLGEHNNHLLDIDIEYFILRHWCVKVLIKKELIGLINISLRNKHKRRKQTKPIFTTDLFDYLLRRLLSSMD